jgi:hypothetical protein
MDSIRHAGEYADEGILFGGTLCAFSLVALFSAYQQHQQIKALARHMRLGAHLSQKARTARRGNNPYRISKSI